MRNTVLKVFFSLLLVLFVVSCNEPDPTIPVAGVSLSKTSLEMTVGDTEELTATVTPAEATNKKVTWTTSDANVAEIIEMRGGGGLQVIAKAPGTATITVKTEDGGKTASCTVTVKAKIIPVESITLDQSEKTLNIGETVTLKATVSPENATNKNISWSSDKTDVATVDENGNVSANSVGTATITATADGVTAECTIIVEEKVIPVESITLNKTEAEIFVGAEEKLTATVLPEDATNKDVTWTSSDTTIATVDSNGKVTAKSVGTAIITAKAGDKSATCTITVNPIKVTNVSITPPVSTTIKSGETLDLEAKVEPTNATNKTVTWSSDNPKVADVDQNGHVVALNQEGTAKITVTTEDGGKTDECIITVTVPEVVIPVEGVTLDKPTLDLKVGESIKLSATVKPDNATIKNVKWTSNNENVATVDGEGNVKAEGPGTTAITVETVDGKKKATCTVNVTKVLVTDVTITEKDLRLARGKSHQLEAIVQPPNATDSSVSWSTNDDTVATVDSNGTVTAKSSGTAVIWAYAGAYNDFCRVEVYLGVESVSIDTPPTELAVGGTATLTATINPSDAEDKTVTWSSDKPEIISVDPSTGEITAHQEGEATITVTTEDGEKTDSCKINVKYISLNGISLNNTEAFLKVNDTLPLTVTFNPENASNKNVTWTSDNPSIATVDSEGKVTAVSSGTAIITATAEEGGKTASCTINVTLPVTKIEFIPNSMKIRMYTSEDLRPYLKFTPEGSATDNVTWNSNDLDVASVTNGMVTGKQKGNATITAEVDGKTASCTVEFYVGVESVSIIAPPKELAVGKDNAITLTASINPYWADYKDVSWSSNKPEIISVDSSTGRIEAHKEGEATITVTTEDGEKTASCTIKAIIPVESVTIVNAPLEMAEGDTITLEADVLPEYATNKTVTWSSSNPEVATIDEETGFLKALKPGTVDITVKAGNGKSQMKRITIEEALVPVESITLDKANGEILVGKTLSLNATVLPDDANKNVTWSSDNEAVATVYQNGTVTGVSAGKATITATAVGGMTAQCNITVVTETDGALTYSFSPYDKTAYVEKCDNSKIGSDGIVVIPDEYAGYKITEIGYKAFENCTNLKSVTIGQNVGTIKGYAFYGCTGLTSITIPGNVEIVYGNAFEGCSGLTSVTLEAGIRQIDGYVFSGCTRLSEIEIPDTVTTIGLGAFFNCTSLSTITIGSGVTSIEDNTFYKCPITSLTNRSTVTPKIEYIRAIYDKDENKESPTIGGIYTSIGEGAFKGTGVKTVVIPANITSIGYQAFDSCDGLTEITIPGTVKSIGSEAFNNCKNLKKVTINSGVESIGITAFSGCPITDLTNDSGLSFNVAYTSAMYKGEPNPVIKDFYTIIDNNAFQGREELQSITIPDNIEMIGGYAFEGCSNLSTVNFGPGSKLTRIGGNAFQNCTRLTSITLPNSVTTIDAAAFSSSGLTSISIPDSVFQIDSQTFMGCTALNSVSIGTGVKTIGNYAFDGCTSLTSVEIPDNVTFIYDGVFDGCSGLTSVTIGEGITSIGQYAFRGCTSVTEYVFRGNTPPELRYEALSGLGEFDIFVPNEAVAAYEKAWPEYVGQIKTR